MSPVVTGTGLGTEAILEPVIEPVIEPVMGPDTKLTPRRPTWRMMLA